MTPYSPWRDLLVRLLLSVLVLTVVGVAVGEPWLVLFVGTFIYLGVHLFNFARLERWLRRNQHLKPPVGHGVWESVFGSLYRLQRRHRQRRRRLVDIVGAFRESVEAMPDAAVLIRDDSSAVWWNSAAERLLGLRRPVDVGRRLENLIRHPTFVAFSRGRFDDTRRIALPSPIDARITLDIRVVPYGRRQRLLLARDITRLTHLEALRRDFIANVSHELRTPLTVVHGLSEALIDSPTIADDEDRELLMLVQQQTQRMSRLVEDLLLLSRLETSEGPHGMAVVDVPTLLQRLREDAIALSGDRNHDIRLQLDTDCRVHAQEHELRSAFSNLVFNAVNYTPDGGRITLGWHRDGDGAAFAVSDTGIGIAAEHLPRLTERFYRVDRGRSTETGGTGLGLAIVKHILQRYDAHLAIESQLGRGSTFQCRFPATRVRETT